MFTRHKPKTVAPPSSKFCHAVGVEDARRWIHLSGQVGATLDGKCAGGAEAQMEQCWRNIMNILADAGMSRDNLVKVTAYITDAGLVPVYRQVRDRVLDGYECASTLVVVSALANPDWVVEIEAVAAAQ
jgi:2-iminobutanoate/2-iminopropanoate deaminase